MAAIWNLIAKCSFWTPLSSSVWIRRTFLCSLFGFDLSCCHCEQKTSWVLLAWWGSVFVQLEILFHYYYQVWPPCIKILNSKPNRFLSPTIPILRIGVSYLIQDHLRTYYWWILGLLLSNLYRAWSTMAIACCSCRKPFIHLQIYWLWCSSYDCSYRETKIIFRPFCMCMY